MSLVLEDREQIPVVWCDPDGFYGYVMVREFYLVKFLSKDPTDFGHVWTFVVVATPECKRDQVGFTFHLRPGDHVYRLTDMEVVALAAR